MKDLKTNFNCVRIQILVSLFIINSTYDAPYSFYYMYWLSFYCDVVTRSRLHLIKTCIDTFLRSFVPLQQNKEKKKANDG